MTEDNHGLDQAKAQAESIIEMVAAINCDYDQLQKLRNELEALAGEVSMICTASAYGLEQEKEALRALSVWKAENLEELEGLEIEAGGFTDTEQARETLQNDPVSVEVRSGWDIVGGDLGAAEFRIVLCTGGPHVEIRGDLNNGTPSLAWLMYQDWGTPLTQYFNVEGDTLLAYCQEFYFGD